MPDQNEAKPMTPQREARANIFAKLVQQHGDKLAPESPATRTVDTKDPAAESSAEVDEALTDPELPPELKTQLKAAQKALKEKYRAKEKSLDQFKRENEQLVQKAAGWRETIDRWERLDPKRREQIAKVFQSADQEDPDADDLDSFLSEIEESGRPVAKRILDLAIKKAGGSRAELVALKKELDELKGHVGEREAFERNSYATEQVSRFKSEVPEYDDLDADLRSHFEDSFARELTSNPRADPVAHWKKFNDILDRRAKRTEDKQKAREKSDNSPVSRSSASGKASPPKFSSRREIFEHIARKNNLWR